MSNIIRIDDTQPIEGWLSISNQGTDCFLELLLMSAECTDMTESQKELIAFFNERREENEIAPGMASFDLEEMPWNAETFREDLTFLLNIIGKAMDPDSWKGLDYEPNKEIVLPWLEQFADMLRQYGDEKQSGMKQVFESDNIRFVEVSEDLIGDYLVMVNDYENVNRYIGGLQKTFTKEQEIQWVQNKLKEKAPVYSMIEKGSETFIGNIELMDVHDSEGELGIAITAEMQDKGYGTEAVTALTEYGFDQLKLKRIFLRTNPKNTRAIRVYEKCGFIEYDRDENHVYMERMNQDD